MYAAFDNHGTSRLQYEEKDHRGFSHFFRFILDPKLPWHAQRPYLKPTQWVNECKK
jgi:hypothetical protein